MIGLVPTHAEAHLLAASGLADRVVIADARDPAAVAETVRRAGGPAQVTVVCVDVPGCEGDTVLATADGGTVIFFSMATSFSAAALGAEGVAADITMLIGNGWCPRTRRPRAGPDPRRAGGAADIREPDGGRVTLMPGNEHTGGTAMPVLALDPAMVRQARELAAVAGQPIVEMARSHTTVSVERAVLRLGGLDGADPGDGMPWVNHLVNAVADGCGLAHGVALPAWDALVTGGYPSLAALASEAAAGKVKFRLPEGSDAAAARMAATAALSGGFARIDARRAERDEMIRATADPPKPWIYLIVATGDIYEDIPQAQAAAREGADIIAVIRSTGQSLLDYVPEGATREGSAGTCATGELPADAGRA